MLILEMIIKITGWTQEKLANYLGVSRVTINYWLNGEDISISSKKLISNKFNFPINFFDVSLEENIELYKIIYSTLYKNYTENIQTPTNTDKEKILNILNRIEAEDKSIYNNPNITENDIIEGLARGYNPFTGEIFTNDHILNIPEVKKVINKIANKYYKFGMENMELEELNYEQRRMFERLKDWRLETAIDEELPAYMIFNNKELINIVCANVSKKEDLLRIKGIGTTKYAKYGDDIFAILNKQRMVI